ncbi:MAG TPA: SpoIIE family protein phosphatase [Chlamydiales bacterium]|nr:SpoIIE family protein phosphatase [Chlamydiales bacterium]
MADWKITKKHHPTGSLARRVLLVSLLLLVIPLFLQSLFLYRQEYKQKLEDVQEILTILAKEREGLIQQMILMDWALLDAVIHDVPEHSKQLKIEEVLLRDQEEDHFTKLDRRRDALLVSKKESYTNALVIPIPFTQFIERLSEEKDSPYPIRMALLDQKGRVLAENMKVSDEDLLTVKEPVEGTAMTLVLTVPIASIQDLQKKDYYYRIAILILSVGVIGGGLVLWLMHRISRPLNRLCKTMERVTEGALHVRYTPDWMGFEINALGKQFNETLDALSAHQQEAEQERIARERLAEELKIGHEIQKSLLPTHLPDFPGLGIAAGYLPALEVSGDFYDLFPLENGKLLIVMADTAGKGVSACLYSLGLRSMIRSLASTTTELAEMVLRVNDLFWLDARNSGMFVTAWIGIYDPVGGVLHYCSQGHPPAILRRRDHLQELWTDGIAMGAQKLEVVPTSQISLSPGDLLLIYTDGVIEAHDPEDHLFGKKRLHEFLLRKKKESSQQIIDQLIEEIHLYAQGVPQHDDITLLSFKIEK